MKPGLLEIAPGEEITLRVGEQAIVTIRGVAPRLPSQVECAALTCNCELSCKRTTAGKRPTPRRRVDGSK